MRTGNFNQKTREKIFRQAVGYYRQKPDVFVENVIGIKLNYYQKLMIRAFFKYNYVLFVMTRGLGKSFTGMLAIVAYCILYPNTRAGIIAPSFRQSKKLIQEKYKDEFCNKFSPFLQQEEETFVCNNQTARVTWFNGSSMEAFPLGIGSDSNAASKIRGARLNIAFCDEAAYIYESIIKEVIIPMLIVAPDYEVGKVTEERRSNKLLLASTASYRFNWLYKQFCEWTKSMLKPDNEDYYTLTLPWQVGVRCGLHNEKFIMQQKATMNSDKFDMEYNGIFPKLIDGVWVNYQDLMKCSDLMHVEINGYDEFEYIMSIDVARIEGGDNSIIDIWKLHWFQDHVEVDLVYTKSFNGATFQDQAKHVRDLLKRFPKVIRIYQDTNGLGVGLADELAKDYYDEKEEKWYPPLIDINNEEQMRKIQNGLPIIYGIKANPEINHNMGMAIKTFTQRHWLHMYAMNADENRTVDLSSEEERQILEAEETRMEILNIKNSPINNSVYVKFYSTSKRKDRWSATCMGIYGAQILYKERNDDSNNMECLVGISLRR